ncbi:uncharacterized protein LOC127142260 [Lates calcarifer]|uniref:Uncharacterized protein LOC127142260 n=1 Tax=Lates calcarifer TaxID=8187 RepID=A0AAJ8B3E3_LATCA|nr:uncharacterized protein LOC127142260 [Lates calcarifer]
MLHVPDEAAGQCYGHSEEICAAVNSNATLPFTANGSDSRWTWQKNGNDLCFCRGGYFDCVAEYQEYRSKIKTFCENLAAGERSITILDVKEHDDAIYALCDERGHCTCVHLAVKPDETGCKNGGSQTKELPVQNPTDPPSDPGANKVAVGVGVGVGLIVVVAAALVIWRVRQGNNGGRQNVRFKTSTTGSSITWTDRCQRITEQGTTFETFFFYNLTHILKSGLSFLFLFLRTHSYSFASNSVVALLSLWFLSLFIFFFFVFFYDFASFDFTALLFLNVL